MTVGLKAKLVAKLPPATPADCAKDYAQHHKPEVAVAVREQHGQTIADAQASSTWHGRRP